MIKKLLPVLLLSSIASAQTLPVDLVIVKHNYARPHEQLDMVQKGLMRLKEAGVSHPITKVRVVKDYLHMNKLYENVSRMYYWADLAYRRHWCSYNRRCHIALPPVFDANGLDYGGGVAWDECTAGKQFDMSYSILRIRNGSGVLRVAPSIITVAHEIAHGDGAYHDDSNPNIMHSAAGHFSEPLFFNDKALTEIRNCLK